MVRIETRKLRSDPCDSTFDCGVAGINSMVKRSYYPTILQHLYCFEILVDGLLVGYYMYGFRKMKLENCPEEIGDYISDMSDDSCYTLHIKYIAVAKKYQKKGIGSNILYLLLRQIKEMCKIWPVRLVTLDALQERVEWYEKNGFRAFNELDIQEGKKDVPMYMDCLLDPKALTDYCS